jgi:hypothetical protein
VGNALWLGLILGLGASVAGAQPSPPAPASPPPEQEERATFDASAFLGLGIDSFAATDLRRYLNPNDSGGVEERLVGGIDFEYRVLGNKELAGLKLWVLGETVHGLRSAEVDCQAAPAAEVCQPFLEQLANPGAPTLFLLRKATSLEAFLGLRFELAIIQRADADAAKLYLKAQAGFLTVAKSGGDVLDSHHVGLGLLAVKGRFAGSYLEVGFGRSDVFLEHTRRRLKIDALLSMGKAGGSGVIRPFVQFTVDSDLGSGADSIQSFLGVDFEVGRLFGK